MLSKIFYIFRYINNKQITDWILNKKVKSTTIDKYHWKTNFSCIKTWDALMNQV